LILLIFSLLTWSLSNRRYNRWQGPRRG
jgi:hypothetical protein